MNPNERISIELEASIDFQHFLDEVKTLNRTSYKTPFITQLERVAQSQITLLNIIPENTVISIFYNNKLYRTNDSNLTQFIRTVLNRFVNGREYLSLTEEIELFSKYFAVV